MLSASHAFESHNHSIKINYFLKKLKIRLPGDPAILLLGVHPEHPKAGRCGLNGVAAATTGRSPHPSDGFGDRVFEEVVKLKYGHYGQS